MDILERYKQQNPVTKDQKSPQIVDEYGREMSGMIALIMRLSGGRIRNIKQASFVLLIIAIGFLIISLLILMLSGTPKGESREGRFPPGSSVLGR